MVRCVQTFEKGLLQLETPDKPIQLEKACFTLTRPDFVYGALSNDNRLRPSNMLQQIFDLGKLLGQNLRRRVRLTVYLSQRHSHSCLSRDPLRRQQGRCVRMHAQWTFKATSCTVQRRDVCVAAMSHDYHELHLLPPAYLHLKIVYHR